MKVNIGEILYSNNYGPFKVIQECGHNENGRLICEIEFINTGYRCIVLTSNVYKGNVKDASIKPIRNISEFPPELIPDFIDRKLRETWKCMLARCTNPNHKEYYAYGGLGVAIDPRWYTFENFKEDCKCLFQYDKFYINPYDYQLDKDYLQQNIPKNLRIYSPLTCIFISNRDNYNLRAIDYAKTHNLTSKYFGVTKIGNSYLMGITCEGNKLELRFTNEIAAANAYNYWFEKLHCYDLVRLHNDVPYMPPEEFVKYIVVPKTLCEII